MDPVSCKLNELNQIETFTNVDIAQSLPDSMSMNMKRIWFRVCRWTAKATNSTTGRSLTPNRIFWKVCAWTTLHAKRMKQLVVHYVCKYSPEHCDSRRPATYCLWWWFSDSSKHWNFRICPRWFSIKMYSRWRMPMERRSNSMPSMHWGTSKTASNIASGVCGRMEREPSGVDRFGRNQTIRLELRHRLSGHVQRKDSLRGHRRQIGHIQVDAQRTNSVLSWADAVRRWVARPWHCDVLSESCTCKNWNEQSPGRKLINFDSICSASCRRASTFCWTTSCA